MADKTERLSYYLARLKMKTPKNLDACVSGIHEAVFSRIDCLSCAECCRSLGPRLTRTDISRLSGTLGLTESDFETEYLIIDEDGDRVFRRLPCPFLAPDNYCLVYADRPKACREYPHTDGNFRRAIPATIMNLKTCPAVVEIVGTLMKRLPV